MGDGQKPREMMEGRTDLDGGWTDKNRGTPQEQQKARRTMTDVGQATQKSTEHHLSETPASRGEKNDNGDGEKMIGKSNNGNT